MIHLYYKKKLMLRNQKGVKKETLVKPQALVLALIYTKLGGSLQYHENVLPVMQGIGSR